MPKPEPKKRQTKQLILMRWLTEQRWIILSGIIAALGYAFGMRTRWENLAPEVGLFKPDEISLVVLVILTGLFISLWERSRKQQKRIKKMSQQLKRLTYMDHLTGLYNDRYFFSKTWGRAGTPKKIPAALFFTLH